MVRFLICCVVHSILFIGIYIYAYWSGFIFAVARARVRDRESTVGLPQGVRGLSLSFAFCRPAVVRGGDGAAPSHQRWARVPLL